MSGEVLERVAKALAAALHAVRPGADPDLVWQVLPVAVQDRYRRAAEAVIVEYVAAVTGDTRPGSGEDATESRR